MQKRNVNCHTRTDSLQNNSGNILKNNNIKMDDFVQHFSRMCDNPDTQLKTENVNYPRVDTLHIEELGASFTIGKICKTICGLKRNNSSRFVY